MIKNTLRGLAASGTLAVALGALSGVASAHSMSDMHDMSMMPEMSHSSVQMPGKPIVYKADLKPLNYSGSYGTATVSVVGDQATVSITPHGLSPLLPHAEHIHLGAAGTCPTMDVDMDHDGLISVTEASPNYGPIKASLTTSGDYSPASGLAVDRFPVGSADGMTTYTRTFTLPEGITAENLPNGVIVQHGISTLFDNPTVYDGAKRSDIAPALPFEATAPANCGPLTQVTPAHMSMPSNYGDDFDSMMHDTMSQMQSDMGNTADYGMVSSGFQSAYTNATNQFKHDVSNSIDAYNSDVAMHGDEARNQLIDRFNNSKARYFVQLEAARNDVAGQLSGRDDVAKDNFVNRFNAARDAYGNQLEVLKNQFAAQ